MRLCPRCASMGPRSSDRGSALSVTAVHEYSMSFNGSTVLGPWFGWRSRGLAETIDVCFNGSTVLGPWFGLDLDLGRLPAMGLQWVHGPRTVVRQPPSVGQSEGHLASMGPRSS